MSMTMDLIRHIAGLYSGKAFKGDFTQIYITGNEIWMAQQILASHHSVEANDMGQAEGAQGEREAAIAKFAETCPMTAESATGGKSYDIELRRHYLLGWDDRAALAQPSPIRCQCCGYLVTDSEHRGCLRAAQQPSPAPELERPEVVGFIDKKLLHQDIDTMLWRRKLRECTEPLMTVAQHQRIDAARVAEIERLKRQVSVLSVGAEQALQERDAAQAKLAAMEKQEPVAAVSEETFSSDGTSDIITRNLPIGTTLYAAPVAQAGQVPDSALLSDIDKHLTDWLDLHECECENGHICGRGHVRATRDKVRNLIAAAPAQGDE